MSSSISDEITFVKNNLDMLAGLANGQFIDPLVRPKSARKQWTTKSYREDCIAGLKWWGEQTPEMQQRFLNGIGGYAQQALNYEFWPQRLRWIYSILNSRPDLKQFAQDVEHGKAMKALRDAEATMNPFDANIHCWGCGKFMHEYDEKNNKRHEKDEVCTCSSSHVLQAQMKERVAAYRKQLAETKKREKAKAARRAGK
jgi:hypothetical protein